MPVLPISALPVIPQPTETAQLVVEDAGVTGVIQLVELRKVINEATPVVLMQAAPTLAEVLANRHFTLAYPDVGLITVTLAAVTEYKDGDTYYFYLPSGGINGNQEIDVNAPAEQLATPLTAGATPVATAVMQNFNLSIEEICMTLRFANNQWHRVSG